MCIGEAGEKRKDQIEPRLCCVAQIGVLFGIGLWDFVVDIGCLEVVCGRLWWFAVVCVVKEGPMTFVLKISIEPNRNFIIIHLGYRISFKANKF